MVKLPSNDPYCFLRLWRYLCPKTAAKTSVEPDARDVRATFVPLIEASFIALRRSFRLDEGYLTEANQVFGDPSGIGLNGTPGTENSVNRTRGAAARFAGLGHRPAVEVLRSHLLNEVSGVAGGLPRCAIKRYGGHFWGWHLPGMRSPIVLDQDEVAKFGIKRSAMKGEYQVQFQIKYEPDFLAADQMTSEDVAELQGAKICFKVWRANTALVDWLPLRQCKPTNALLYQYREAMSVLRLAGAAPKETAKKTVKTRKEDSDLSGWGEATHLARARLLQSLADRRFYAKGYGGTSRWETKAGIKVKQVNIVDLKLPQKVGRWRKTSLRLGFLPYVGDRCHVRIKIGREGIAVATRSQNQSPDVGQPSRASCAKLNTRQGR